MIYVLFYIASFNIFIKDRFTKSLHLFTFLNRNLLIYRAIEDLRYNCTRILGAMNLSINLSKILIKADGIKTPFIAKILGKIIKFNIEFPLKYVNFIINTTNANSISVNDICIPLQNVKKINYIYHSTVCITSIKNKFAAKTVVAQTLRIYQKEGVSHAIVYYDDISEDVYNVLKSYQKIGFLEAFYWPQLEILSYIRNYGQVLKMNDCLYRSYYNSRYIINSDIDEIIMSKTFYTLKELIDYYLIENSSCGIFHFYSKTFPTKKYIDNISKRGRESYTKLPPIEDFNLFDKTLSCKETMIRTKYITSTSTVEALRFHDTISNDKHCAIWKKDGYCRHTRIIPINNVNLCKNLTHDYTIYKYVDK